MSKLEIEGTLVLRSPVISGTSAKGEWKKQEFLVEYIDGTITRKVMFSAWGDDKVQLLSNINEGSKIKVAFNLSSREWNGKWYSDIQAWQITPLDSNYQSDSEDMPLPPPPTSQEMEEDDDLPF